eukprot:720211_1
MNQILLCILSIVSLSIRMQDPPPPYSCISNPQCNPPSYSVVPQSSIYEQTNPQPAPIHTQSQPYSGEGQPQPVGLAINIQSPPPQAVDRDIELKEYKCPFCVCFKATIGLNIAFSLYLLSAVLTIVYILLGAMEMPAIVEVVISGGIGVMGLRGVNQRNPKHLRHTIGLLSITVIFTIYDAVISSMRTSGQIEIIGTVLLSAVISIVFTLWIMLTTRKYMRIITQHPKRVEPACYCA